MVLGQEDHVGDEWAKEKEKEEAAAAEEVVGEVGEASSSGLPPHQGIPLTLPLRHLYLTCVTFL